MRFGRRQVEEAVRVEEGDAAVLLPDLPVLALDHQRRAGGARRGASITASASGSWRPTMQPMPCLRMPAFSPAISAQRLAEVLLVVDRRPG